MLSRASKKWERGPWGWCLLAFHQCPEPILQTVIQGQPVSVLQSPWLFLPSICLFGANGTGSISILFASWQSLTLSAQALRTPESLCQTSRGHTKMVRWRDITASPSRDAIQKNPQLRAGMCSAASVCLHQASAGLAQHS